MLPVLWLEKHSRPRGLTPLALWLEKIWSSTGYKKKYLNTNTYTYVSIKQKMIKGERDLKRQKKMKDFLKAIIVIAVAVAFIIPGGVITSKSSYNNPILPQEEDKTKTLDKVGYRELISKYATTFGTVGAGGVDNDNDSISDELEDYLLNQFAPVVILHPDDWNRPCNVDWFLLHSHMRFNHKGGCGDCEILSHSEPNQANIIGQQHQQKDGWPWCDHNDHSEYSWYSFDPDQCFFLQLYNPDHSGSPNPSDWIVYGHVYPNSFQGVNVQYWFMYAYNDGYLTINHEGDWENIIVEFDNDWTIRDVVYYQHGYPNGMSVSDVTWYDNGDGGSHPVVVSACGSHASYPSFELCEHHAHTWPNGATPEPGCFWCTPIEQCDRVWFTWAGGKPAGSLGFQGGGVINVGERHYYVSGSHILQDAINAASPGDTIYVHNGTYYENIVINKPINLIGEDRNHTIIYGKAATQPKDYLNGQKFIFYSGRWGEIGEIDATCGPQGPAYQDSWWYHMNTTNGDGVVVINADNVTLSGFTIKNRAYLGSAGIYINSNYTAVTGNNIRDNMHGIYLDHGSNNVLSDNNITCRLHGGYFWHDSYGIGLYDSSDNIIAHNTIISCGATGITLMSSNSNHNNTIYMNTVTDNINGISLESGAYNTILQNIITHNSDTGIDNGGDNNTISRNTITNNSYNGISLGGPNNIVSGNTIADNNESGISMRSASDNNTLCGNTITDNCYGISVGDSQHGLNTQNTIIEGNTISHNDHGIYLYEGTSNSIIYHNNLTNSENAYVSHGCNDNQWYDQTLHQGNYWDDYIGVDENHDGIGDTPYHIQEQGMDAYPLMSPYCPSRLVENLNTGEEFVTIQGAIDTSHTGDTLFVHSSMYYENIIVDRAITLIGEDRYTTIIDGAGNENVVDLSANGVTISGFTIRNGEKGIYIRMSDHNTIIGNKITNTDNGIYLDSDGSWIGSNYNSITGNG